MLVVWKVALLTLVGLCCCVSALQECTCLEAKACIESNGTVSNNTSENNSTNTCRGGDVMCCAPDASTSTPKNPLSVLKEPKVAPGGGCGRKRFPAEGEELSSKNTFYGDAPWTVEILNDISSLRCSGTLISPRVVLTAAHCIGKGNESRGLSARAGEYVTTITNKPLPPQTRKVHKIISHSGFNEHNITNDIALMVLKEAMELNAAVDVICTPEEGQEVITTDCFATGYGITEENEKIKYEAEFKKMKYAYMSPEDCIEKLKSSNSSKFFYESNICGMGDEGNTVTRGDGGGPLFCPSRADPNRMVQIGIVSWAVNSDITAPAVFTSVKHYLPWVKETLKKI